MFTLFSQYSRTRFAWMLLLLSALMFEAIALYFQHYRHLSPCVLCIYQRCAIFGIAIAAMIALINPRNGFWRLCALALWIYSAWIGFGLAHQQAKLQFAPSLFETCPVYPEFPNWLPLDKLLPSVFAASGSCADKVWQFMTIEMSQWMQLIFIAYLLVAAVILLAQFFKPTTRRSF